MAREKSKKSTAKWFSGLRNKYRLVILNDQTLEEKISLRLSKMNVFVVLGSLTIFLVIITSYIIAFTPLKEYIPGYSSLVSQQAIYRLQLRADSLEEAMNQKELYILNIRNIIEGKEILDEIPAVRDTQTDYKNIQLKKTKEDSLLRVEIESEGKYNLTAQAEEGPVFRSALSSFLFFTPLKGLITNNFDPVNNHYGIDIVAKKNELVKAALDGRVIMADWTLETGYTISIQHQSNIVTVYKHNASVLIKPGTYVKAGEPIAFVGGSGELSSGPHLHFELWYNGNPVNPRDFISF
ncbi:MAG TPA: M23 family metallopeptidase [Bacteroidales bacterium]|nr:M23 family metallopeptidase [Bacteroidales bacterium]HSA43913.1 M23 family metallopeptidase [Bacteroidales bacterium]